MESESKLDLRNIASASMLLFRVATGEAWQLIMLACIEAECDEVSLNFSWEGSMTPGHELIESIECSTLSAMLETPAWSALSSHINQRDCAIRT